MRRREERRKREREQLPSALVALVALVPCGNDARKFLQDKYGAATPAGTEDDGNGRIDEAGIARLLEDLGPDSCPEGAMDLLRITRRVPRSQSSPDSLNIAELCFAIGQASGPVNVHERRRAAGKALEPLDEETPLIQYYKGRRFAALIHGQDPSSPLARAANTDADEAEWQEFAKSLATPLPMTLRVHACEPVLRRLAFEILNRPGGDEAAAALETAEPSPDTMGTPSGVASVVKPVTCTPPCADLYSCSNMDYHTHPRAEYVCRTLHTSSAVSFQEVVSALPVLALDIQPHHTVIDLCAAPGSKTLQALDGMMSKHHNGVPGLYQGVLIANEKDRIKATQTLPARLKRYHAPNVMSTRCDAVQWPRLYEFDAAAPGGEEPRERRFDRVLCDVPCSGDGTIRKERSVASTWSTGYVKSLLPTQKALLRRGLDMLNDDGILVYSTCSMNPKEDEEVVCAALEQFGDSVELIDVNARLASLGGRLLSRGGIEEPNVEDLHEHKVPANYDGRRVLRVLPHRNDTGGFFIAAFRKVKQPDWTGPTGIRTRLNQWMKSKLWAPVAEDDPTWANIADFYQFDRHDTRYFSYLKPHGLPSDSLQGQGLVPVYHLNPNGGPNRRIVLATHGVAKMLFQTAPFKGPGVEVVAVGMRAFEAYDGKFLTGAQCRWRAVAESASYLAPLFQARRLELTVTEANHAQLVQLLRDGFLPVHENWRLLVNVSSDASATAAAKYPFFIPDSALVMYLEAVGVEAADEAKVQEYLTPSLMTGGVLIGLRRHARHVTADEAAWYMSATLSGFKIELAIDGSLKAFGLMAFLNVCNVMSGTAAEEAKVAERLD